MDICCSNNFCFASSAKDLSDITLNCCLYEAINSFKVFDSFEYSKRIHDRKVKAIKMKLTKLTFIKFVFQKTKKPF